MKALIFTLLLVVSLTGSSQNWLTTGNNGLTPSGFLGSTDASDIIFKANNVERARLLNAQGAWRFGSATNNAKIDSTGKLSFNGSGSYYVGSNKYAFQYAAAPNYGLFFNSTNVQYEFRNGSAVPVFYINANNGNGVFNGTLKIGAYTLPATDGTGGQVLKTDGAGILSWSPDNGMNYAPGLGIGITGNTIFNTLPDKIVSLTGTGSTTVTGTYPNFTISSTDNNTTYSGGTGINVAGTTINNTAPDQTVTLTGNGATSVTGTYPNFTVSSTDNNTTYSGGTGINVSGTTINNTAPDQTVTITGNGATSVTGTYPNFTISSTDNNTTYSAGTGISLVGTTFSNTGDLNAGDDASLSLSNLTTTAINQSLLPGTDSSIDVGSVTKSWRDIFLDGAVYLGGKKFLTDRAGTGAANTAVGEGTLAANDNGPNNTAIGYQALYSNIDGSGNTATGNLSLYANTEGYGNTATGNLALYSNTTGIYNTATGVAALINNSTGTSNTATGNYTLYYNTTGYGNTATGVQALHANTTGTYNNASGFSALDGNTTGYRNTAAGYSAGSYNDNNTYCTFVGSDADQSVTTDFTNSMALGNASRITASNQVRIGNSSVTSIGGYAGWTNVSDGRIKKDIKENVPGLQFINKLKPVTYHLNIAKARNFLGEDIKEAKSISGINGEPSAKENDVASNDVINEGIASKEKVIYTGFVAQDVEKAAREIGYDFSGVDKPENENALYGLRYAEFVVPLVKAVQELSSQNDDLKTADKEERSEIADLKVQVNELKSLITSLRQKLENCNACPQQQAVNTQQLKPEDQNKLASLEQNIPNPFSGITVINYTIPQYFGKAQIMITDKTGKLIKQINITAAGKGAIKVDASMLASGAYQYTLYVDGKMIDSRQMIFAK